MPRKVDEDVTDPEGQDNIGAMLDEGSEADTEWSDQEAEHRRRHKEQESEGSVRSLSLNLNLNEEDCDTDTEKTPRLDEVYSMKGVHGNKSGRTGPSSSQGKKRSKALRYDAADYIMDKIDSELYSITGIEPHSLKRGRPNKQQRSSLRDQGVEFDTGDETNHDSRRYMPDSLGKLHRKQAAEKDEGDTGLGTASVDGDSDAEPHIVGKADIYESESSEEEDSGQKVTPRYDTLDSDMAKQLEEKYKHILKSKNKARRGPSDLDSVRTEDYERAFQMVMVPPRRAHIPDAPSMPTFARNDSLTDHDSVKTEDIEKEYRKTLVTATGKPPVTSGKSKSKIKYKTTAPKRVYKTWDGSKPVPKGKFRPSFKTGSKKSRHAFGAGGHSDLESVMTEDYESQFHNVMVKQVANVPIMTFDKFLVDSDVDTVRSQYIRDRFQAALCKSMCSDSEGASSDGESSNMEALIERKFQEIIRRTQLQIAGVDSSGTDTTGKRVSRAMPVMNGDSEGEEAFQNTWPRAKPSRKQRKSPDYRFRRMQHSDFPPAIWEREELARREHPRKESNASTVSTFEEVESLEHSRSLSHTDSGSFSGSTGVRSLEQSIDSGDLPRYPVHRGRSKWRRTSQPSTVSDKSSLSTNSYSLGRSNETFEEVESIDFGGHHELDGMDLQLPGIGGLSYQDVQRFNKLHSERVKLRNKFDAAGGERRKKQADNKSTTSFTDSSVDSSEKKARSRRKWDLIDPNEGMHPLPPPSKPESRDRHAARQELRQRRPHDFYDAGHKNIFEQLMDHKMRKADTMGTSSGSTASSLSAYPGYYPSHPGGSVPPPPPSDRNRHPFETPYEFHVRKNRRMSVASGMNRTASMDSTNSSVSSASFADPTYGMAQYMMPSTMPAEDTLMNLGFSGSGSFLPERFARDWCQKLIHARAQSHYPPQRYVPEPPHVEPPDMFSSFDTSTGLSRSSSFEASPIRDDKSGRNMSEFLHNLDVNSRYSAHSRRAKLKRSATILTYHQGDKLFDAKSSFHKSKDSNAGSFEKQDSIDQLKYVLEKQANILNGHGGPGDVMSLKKRKQFANSRQKSLPIALETLSEEEESKVSRGPSVDKAKGGKLMAFLEEEERLSRASSSEGSSCSKEADPARRSSRTSRASSESGSAPISSRSSVVSDISDSDFESNDGFKLLYKRNQEIDDLHKMLDRKVKEEHVTCHTTSSVPVPMIIVSNSKGSLNPQSSASMEVDDILSVPSQYQDTGYRSDDASSVGSGHSSKSGLAPEPALVSIVLSDCDDRRAPSPRMAESDGQLVVPALSVSPFSRSSSATPGSPHIMSISPITVIEVDQLDNQNDSLDSSQSSAENSSSEEKRTSCPRTMLRLISEDSEEADLMLYGFQPPTSSPASPLSPVIHVPTQKGEATLEIDYGKLRVDSLISADDGRLSPLVMVLNHGGGQERISRAGSESAYESSGEERVGEVRDQAPVQHVQIQADDGRLTPIMFEPANMERYLDTLPEHMCVVTDTGTQYDPAVDAGKETIEVQTEGGAASGRLVHPTIATSSQTSFLDTTSYERRTSEFEPMLYYLSEGCQTDGGSLTNSDLTDSTATRLTVKFQPFVDYKFLCQKCKMTMRTLSDQSSVGNFDRSVSQEYTADAASPEVIRPEPCSPQALLSSTPQSPQAGFSYAGRKALDLTIDRLNKKTRRMKNRVLPRKEWETTLSESSGEEDDCFLPSGAGDQDARDKHGQLVAMERTHASMPAMVNTAAILSKLTSDNNNAESKPSHRRSSSGDLNREEKDKERMKRSTSLMDRSTSIRRNSLQRQACFEWLSQYQGTPPLGSSETTNSTTSSQHSEPVDTPREEPKEEAHTEPECSSPLAGRTGRLERVYEEQLSILSGTSGSLEHTQKDSLSSGGHPGDSKLAGSSTENAPELDASVYQDSGCEQDALKSAPEMEQGQPEIVLPVIIPYLVREDSNQSVTDVMSQEGNMSNEDKDSLSNLLTLVSEMFDDPSMKRQTTFSSIGSDSVFFSQSHYSMESAGIESVSMVDSQLASQLSQYHSLDPELLDNFEERSPEFRRHVSNMPGQYSLDIFPGPDTLTVPQLDDYPPPPPRVSTNRSLSENMDSRLSSESNPSPLSSTHSRSLDRVNGNVPVSLKLEIERINRNDGSSILLSTSDTYRSSASIDNEPADGNEKVRLAASIVNDIFDDINGKLPAEKKESVSEAELDYTILRAVNRTLDRLFSNENVDESASQLSNDGSYRTALSTPARRPSSASKQKMRQHDENAEMELGEEARQMERESARMRQEVESERKRSSKKGRDTPKPKPERAAMTMSLPVSMPVSPARFSSMTAKGVDQHVSLRLQQELAKLQASIQQARRDKQTLQLDMKQIQNEIKQHESDKKNAERQMKENRARAEDARTELMLAEFKRDSAKKELDNVSEDLDEKKTILEKAAKEAELIDQRKETYEQVSAEREELQLRVKNMAQLDRERQELEQQLANAKQNLITEQKRSREKLDAMRERHLQELDTREARLDDVGRERDSVQRKHDQLDQRLSQFEADRSAMLQERTAELEDARSKLHAELTAAKSSTSKEVMEVRAQLKEVTDRLANSQSEINRRDEENMKLREQILQLQHEVTKASENKSAIHEEAQQNINAIIQEKEATLATVIREAEQEKHEAIEHITRDLERQHKQLMAQAEGRYQHQVSDAQGLIAAKEIELEVLRDRHDQQDHAAKSLQEKIRTEAQDRFCHLMKEERGKWEMDRGRTIDHEIDMMRGELEKEARLLRDELTGERDVVESQIKQITCLKKELEEARQTNRNIYREKLAALNQVKESAEMEKERQMDIMKEKLEHETHRSIDRLRETIRHQEDELQRLRQENTDMRSSQHDNVNSAESFERSIIEEINDECRRTAQILGASARTVSITGFTSWSPGRVVSGQSKPSLRPVVSAAVNNMKLSHEDLRKAVSEVQAQLTSRKQKLNKMEREKKDEFDKLRHKMQNEKIAALETLKDRLIKEHLEEVDKLHRSLGKGKSMGKTIRDKDSELQDIQRNMNKWKDQTTEKLARKFQEELNRELEKRMKEMKKKEREWEREKAGQAREIEKLERDVRRVNNTSTTISSPSRMSSTADESNKLQLQQLQGKVKLLQNENMSLRRSKLTTSVPDLSIMNASLNNSFSLVPTKDDHHLSHKHTELQIQRSENRAKLAEDRAEKNEKLLNQKMLELSKLQGTLTQQTKELMQLERSYSQLQRPASQPLRAASPIRIPSRPSSRIGFPR